jgi:hypothetical protein
VGATDAACDSDAVSHADKSAIIIYLIDFVNSIICILVSTVANEDLRKEGLSIVGRIREFITTNQEIHRLPAARRLLALIERPVRQLSAWSKLHRIDASL